MPRKRPRKRATNEDPSVIVRVNIISIILILVFTGIGVAVTVRQQNPAGVFVGAVIGLVLAQSPKIAKQWERAVVLRLGKYVGLRGPGLFWIVPLVDTVSAWIDQRVITTNFKAEETLTLETSTRCCSGPWGVTVQSVEMRDVVIPTSLQDAMSREAQASREKQARIILGQAEVEIASLFAEASRSYHENPTALHLRAMNILYEGLKEKGALMLVPSTAVESMGLGGMLGMAAMRQDKLSAGEGS